MVNIWNARVHSSYAKINLFRKYFQKNELYYIGNFTSR